MNSSTRTTYEARFTSPQLRDIGFGISAILFALLSIYNMTGTIQFAPVPIGVGIGSGVITMYGIMWHESSNYSTNIGDRARILAMIVVIGVGALLLTGFFL